MRGEDIMIREKQNREVVIDLDGPRGNAFALMASAERYARQLGIDHLKVMEEMKEGDYTHLVKTFNKYFPMVILETEQEDLLRELS